MATWSLQSEDNRQTIVAYADMVPSKELRWGVRLC